MDLKELLKKLILNGKDANTRYLPPLSPLSKNLNIENIDKLFISLLEEIYEAKETNNEEEFFSECCDVLNFSTTIVSVYITWFNNEFNISESYESLILKILSADFFSIKYYFSFQINDFKSFKYSLFDDFTKEFIFNFIGCRRNFPERKWHRNGEKLKEKELFKTLELCMQTMINFSIELIYFIEIYLEKDYLEIWNQCNYKHEIRLP